MAAPEPKSSDIGLNLGEYAKILNRRKWYLILAVVLVTGTAIGFSYTLTRQYEAKVLVRMGKQSILGRAVRGLTPDADRGWDMRSRSEKTVSILRRLRSTAYLEQLIGRMGWVDEILAEGGPEAEAAEQVTSPADKRRAIVSLLLARLQGAIDVTLIGNEHMEITFTSTDPEEARDAVEHLAEIFRESMIKEEVAAIRVAGEFSEEQLELYRGKWEEAQSRLVEFKSQKARDVVDETLESEYNLQDITAEKDRVDLAYSTAEARITDLENQLGEELVTRADFIYSDRLAELKSEQLNLIDQLGSLLGRYTWKDKTIVDYNYRLGTGLNNIQAEISRIVDETFANLTESEHENLVELVYLQHQLEFLKQRQQVMNRIVNRIRDRMATGPEYEQKLRSLETEEATSRDIYNRFVEQYTGAQIRQAEQRAAAESKYTMIEPPKTPTVPIYPDRKKIAMAAAMVGLMIGVVLVLITEYTDRSFRTVEDMEDYLGYRVLATLPKVTKLKEAKFAQKG